MTDIPARKGSPEERIIRELTRTSGGGVEAGEQSQEYGRVLETLLIRELQILTSTQDGIDLRFARGYVVDDYGDERFESASAKNAGSVDTADIPRFDIVCYHGDVAWRSFSGFPFAMVPKSFVHGIIEVKRTLSPGYLPASSSRGMNEQFRSQRDYLRNLGIDPSFIVIGAHYRGEPEEIRSKALATHVALLGDLSGEGSAKRMAQPGELKNVVELLVHGSTEFETNEKVEGLQDIARDVVDDNEF